VADDPWHPPSVLLTVDLVILTLRDGVLHLLLVERGVDPFIGMAALPGGFLRDLEEPIVAAAHRELSEEAGLDADALHLEQLGVYGDPGRDPRGRVVTVAFLAIAPRLPEPMAGTDAADARWVPIDDVLSGRVPLAFDHRRIVLDGVERARRKLEHSALATAFCGQTFTLSELQQVYEAVWGARLDSRNFYRKIQNSPGFVVAAGPARKTAIGRPARLFRAGPCDVLNPPITRTSAGESTINNVPIVILTAMSVEYDAVRAQLRDIQMREHKAGTLFEVGRIAGEHSSGDCQVAIAATGMGNQPTAVLAERAIAEFAPKAILFTGVAGALRQHLELGDVVVASYVYAYHGGTSEDDGLKARPRSWELSHRVRQLAEHLVRSGTWAQRLPEGTRSQVRFGPIAAGEVVHYSATSSERRWLTQHYSDAIAVEMEGAGTASAAHLNDSLPAVVIRGISDYADSGKPATDGAGWQSRAAVSAAAFAIELASILTAELGGMEEESRDHSEDDDAGRQVNLARDNAKVRVQAHTVYGGIRFGPDADLGSASSAALTRPTGGPGKIVKAVQRGYALIGNVAELMVKVIAALTAVRGLT
jgi:8-oxo-dGTP diphosphatase